ncbi:MAG: hypothetical protein MJZ23_01220 [Paludibacteraceae bacterium]|nr:hypothetical protein [Paludibacteraceae bacterium]
MRKRLLTTTALLLGSLCASAAVQYMTVEQKSGAKYSFLLKDNPVVTYQGGELVVNGSASTSYALDGVKNYHFTESDLTGVETTGVDMLRITTDENTVLVENAPAGAKVVLVNAGGATVAVATADQSGTATISLPSVKGVYALTLDKQSFKLIRN